jgi:DNA-binding NtrC family response regulator
MARARGDRELTLDAFPPSRVAGKDAEARYVFHADSTYRENRARFEAGFERAYVEWLLERHGGNYAAAARSARMDRTHLMDLAKKHGVESGRRRG